MVLDEFRIKEDIWVNLYVFSYLKNQRKQEIQKLLTQGFC